MAKSSEAALLGALQNLSDAWDRVERCRQVTFAQEYGSKTRDRKIDHDVPGAALTHQRIPRVVTPMRFKAEYH
jgi:hypothetical protein